MSEDLERRRVEAMERLAAAEEAKNERLGVLGDRTGDLSNVSRELLDEIKREAVVEATEVVTTMNSEAKLVQRHNVYRLALRLAAATIGWVWFAVGVVDWHVHRHLAVAQVPLAPAGPSQFPIGVAFSVASVVFIAGLLVASRKNGS